MMGPVNIFNCFALPGPLYCNRDYNGVRSEQGIEFITGYVQAS